MAITELTDTEVVQHCTKCSRQNRIAIDALEAGVAHGDQPDGRIVPLPACPTCRSTEFLIRSPDDEPAHPAPGSFGHLHRMLVDVLHAGLIEREKVIPVLKDHHSNIDVSFARPISDDDIQRWFPKGLKIELREAEPPVSAKGPGQ